MDQSTYLVEFEMRWAGKVVREGVEEVRSYSEWDASTEVRNMLLKLNKKADITIGDVVRV